MSKILTTLKQESWPQRVVIGVSGGVDSVVLLDAFTRVQPDSEVIIAHVNYHLRPESDADAALVAALAEKYHAKLAMTDCQITKDSGIEDAARHFRYQFFDEVASQYHADRIIVAHHADDQVETILLKLIRGGDSSQMTGMASRRDRLIRPFLNVWRDEILNYAAKRQLKWHEDQTNWDPSYTARNRLRHEIIPNLGQINPRATEHILDFANHLQSQEELIREQIQQWLPMVAHDWRLVPPAWRSNVLMAWLRRFGLFAVKSSQIQQICQLIENSQKPNGQIALGDGYFFIKTYQNLTLKKLAKPRKKAPESPTLMLELDQWQFFENEPICWTSQQPDENSCFVELPALDLTEPLLIRVAQKDDKLAIKGGGHKLVRRFWIDNKVPSELRPRTLVITNQNGQLCGLRLPNHPWRIGDNLATSHSQMKPSWLVWRIEEN